MDAIDLFQDAGSLGNIKMPTFFIGSTESDPKSDIDIYEKVDLYFGKLDKTTMEIVPKEDMLGGDIMVERLLVQM